jgi:hypothetical protein
MGISSNHRFLRIIADDAVVDASCINSCINTNGSQGIGATA